MGLTVEEEAELIALLEADELAAERSKLFSMYPETGPLRRELYPRHMEFFAAGREHRERLMLAANRVGKTWGVGAYEVTLHLTGLYPDWWPGRRFNRPIRAWVAGKTNETTRDVVQAALCGKPAGADAGRKGFDGKGMIPHARIGQPTWKQGVADLADTVPVTHRSGGQSVVGFKAYQQGRGSFEGTAQDLIWFDEEPPSDVYAEALVRTMTTDGLVLLTFTPMEGVSDVVKMFLEDVA